MNEEEAVKILIELSTYDYVKLENGDEAIETVLNLIENQKAEIEEYKAILDIANNRKYHKKYLKERRKEEPNLLYQDADEIYERYYKQKEELEKKDKIIKELEEKLSERNMEKH